MGSPSKDHPEGPLKPQHPDHTTWLGTCATTVAICGYVAPSSNANSPPRDIPKTPIRVASTAGCSDSQFQGGLEILQRDQGVLWRESLDSEIPQRQDGIPM